MSKAGPSVSASRPSPGEVFARIDRIAKRLRRIHEQTIRDTALTPAQYQVLVLLGQRDRQPLSELARACQCTRATLTGIADSLEKNGLARREPNPGDRRSLLVALTRRGRETLRAAPALDATIGCCCDGLAPAELSRLDTLLRKLEGSLSCAGGLS